MPKSFTQMKHPEVYRSPLPLHETPWFRRMLGYGKWRYRRSDMSWAYLSDAEYFKLFGRWP